MFKLSLILVSALTGMDIVSPVKSSFHIVVNVSRTCRERVTSVVEIDCDLDHTCDTFTTRLQPYGK